MDAQEKAVVLRDVIGRLFSGGDDITPDRLA